MMWVQPDLKTCLFSIGEELTLLASEMEGYDLYILDNGGAEQDPLQWWEAMCSTTQKLLSKKPVLLLKRLPEYPFCSQMQGLVLVDRKANRCGA
jgi:xylulokinase